MSGKLLFLFESCDSCDSTENQLIKNIFDGNWNDNIDNETFKNYVVSGEENFNKDEKLAYSISCLLSFLEVNFVGSTSRVKLDIQMNCADLQVDGIEINANMKNIEYLLIANTFLNDLIKSYPDDILILIWYMRMIKIHQSALDENSMTLFDTFKKIQEKLSRSKLEEIENIRHRFIIQLEIISIYLMYRRVYKVDELIKELKNDYHIETVEEGILGKRTKWQEKALPQFHVSIQGDKSDLFTPPQATHENVKLLKLLELEDDTRLESVKYMDEKHNELQILSSLLQNFVLLNIKYLQISQPKDKLSDEEIQSYLMLLLKQNHGAWSIRLESLLINIKLESNHQRTIDRCLRQCEYVINIMTNNEDELKSSDKLSYIFSSIMTPRYKIEGLLADLMVSLGLIKGALDVYLRIQQWEEVINCYTRLQLKHKAAEIIQQELEKKPTAKLYCLLGDALDDITYYEKAWEFSNNKSGLAQKHFGMFYFGKNDYEKAIPHLQKSLEINSLQENLWLRLGYAALSLEKYEIASKAYLRYTQLEPNGFESWNNLAKCFIKLGNKKRAHKVLQEALKCNFDNWKIWENFLFVSIDIGSFEDGLNAYSRLIELKEKYFDEEVLTILINAISNDLVDIEGNKSKRLRKKALEMLAHIGSINMSQGIVWELSALLTDEPLKRAEKLQKAYKGYVSKSPDWAKDEQMCLKFLNLSYELCSHSLNAANDVKETERMLVLSQLSSARLTGQGCVKVAVTNQYESCKDLIEKVNELLDNIVTKIKALK
ncbi:tetratricopeptide repeat protein 27 [Chironomus tepperi]|uniref:tetratricopeptide repeat protein 27 n=1 Tax=Chironomus tepperi TaxID=113505 RepID=UPI00391F8F0D